MRYHEIEVRKSELSSHREWVPAWEIPILQVVHGRENITQHGFRDIEDDRRPWPDTADSEWVRLQNRYGTDKSGDREVTFVSLVYGGDGVGQTKLEEAIQKERDVVAKLLRKTAQGAMPKARAIDPLEA